MRILVTGGAGLIGSHSTDLLVLRHDVTVLDDLSTGSLENLPASARLVRGDIRDLPLVEATLEEGQFDAILHCAAHLSLPFSIKDPAYDAEVNIMAGLHLLHSAKKHGVKTFVFSSTGGIMYGDTDHRPTPETEPEGPLSPYGVSKLAFDNYLRVYRAIHGMRTVSLRYSNVYGPRQVPHGEASVTAIFMESIRAGCTLVIHGDGEQTRDYVYVEDVARANVLALENDRASGIFHVGTGVETSVNGLFEIIQSVTGTTLVPTHDAPRPEQRTSCLSWKKAKEGLGWEPQVALQEGIRRTWEWYEGKR